MYQEIMYSAFVDELTKIGHIDEAMAELILKEAGVLGAAARAGSKLKGLVSKAPKSLPPVSPGRMAAIKAQAAVGAGRSGQATRRISAPAASVARPVQARSPLAA